MSATIPTYMLNNGLKIPAVGLGSWLGEVGGTGRAYNMCRKAIEIGYRHIDTAAGYGNEEGVGRAVRDSGISRTEFFVTTKLQNTDHHRVREAFERSLAELDIGYIDLYLVHWPQAQPESNASAWGSEALPADQSPTIPEVWAEMEKLLETGKVKSIGVSNYSVKTLEVLLATAKVVPAVNQIQLHPFLPQHEFKKYLNSKGIHVTAYSSFGQPVEGLEVPSLLKNDVIVGLADKHQATTGQILVSWAVQRGTSAIPKSESEDRLRKNFTLVKLDDEDIRTLDNLHRQPGLHRSLLGYHEGGKVFGWTHEQLGWNLTADGHVLE